MTSLPIPGHVTVTSAPAVKRGLFRAAEALFVNDPDVQVLYGLHPPTGGRDGLAIGNIVTVVERPTMGPQRSREEVHEVTVMGSVLRPGSGDAAQMEATERAYQLVDTLAEYLRTNAAETFDAAARVDAWVSQYDLDEHADDETTQTHGRYAAVTAVVTVTCRLPGARTVAY